MTRELRTDELVVALGSGTWTAHWPEHGVTAGPFGAHAEGRWRVEPGDGFGRPGAWARWRPTGEGPTVDLHVPAHGDTVVVETADGDTRDVRSVTPATPEGA